MLFLYYSNGCLKCGMNHPTSTCKNPNIPGFPCKKHKMNDPTGCYHNEAFHCDNWQEIRKEFFLPRSQTSSLETGFGISDSSVNQISTESSPSAQNSEFVYSFDDSYNPTETGDTFSNQFNVNTLSSASFSEFDDSKSFLSLSPSITSYRPFSYVLISDVKETIRISI